MRFFKYFVLAVCWFCLSVYAAKPEDLLVNYLGGYSSFQADFKQVTVDDHQQILQQAQGKVFIQRPGRMRWAVSKPDPDLIIINKDILWRYDSNLKQASKRNLSKEILQANSPALLLSRNVDKVLREFNIYIVKLQGKKWFKLVSRNKDNSGGNIVYLNFARSKLSRIIIVNSLGQRSLFAFSNVFLNHHISKAVFNFIPPKGVDVDEQ